MTAPGTRNLPPREAGAALLLLLLIVIVAAAATLVGRLGSVELRVQQDVQTKAALARGKHALLEYATTVGDLVGGADAQLPCPDIDATGPTGPGESHAVNCGAQAVTMLGRLPWKTLGIGPQRDGRGECLWYVVSGTYKHATLTGSGLVNPDANGQLQLVSYEDGQLLHGNLPAERPVAMILAPLQPLPGQSRQAPLPAGPPCGSDFDATAFLDADGVSGISNAVTGGIADTIDQFIVSTANNEAINDRIIYVSRSELSELVYQRHDFDLRIAALTAGVAACIAEYGRANPGGADDRRLPWPAPLQLIDYRPDVAYDDADNGIWSGRLPDRVDDSNAVTGNPISRAIADCDPLTVPAWDPQYFGMWQHWKDHFFLIVAESFQPNAPVPSVCSDCLTVNGAGSFAAIVFFAGARLDTLAQVRDAPPLDLDTRDQVSNYLEDANAANHPYVGGTADYRTQAESAVFNDVGFCINPDLTVVAC